MSVAEDDSILEDEDLLEEMVRAIVASPDKVQITASDKADRKNLIVHVSPEDRGRVIGRHGKMIGAIRAFMGAVGTMSGHMMTVELAEDVRKNGSQNGEERRDRQRAHKGVPAGDRPVLVRRP